MQPQMWSSQLIKDHEEKAQSIEALKLAVEELIEAVIGFDKGKSNSPAFIFIDELDRCRPSYAVEMLETIKHIFNIPNAVFVIATDTDQLQHSIKVIYGEEFEAGKYLGRFFNARYALNRPSFDLYFNSVYGQEFKEGRFDNLPLCSADIPVLTNLSNISGAFFESVRDATKVMDRFLAIADNLKSYESLNIYYLFILLCIYEKRHQDFDELINIPVKFENVNSAWIDWFSKLNDVKWDREIKVYINVELLSGLLESQNFNRMQFDETANVGVKLDKFLLLVSYVYKYEFNSLINLKDSASNQVTGKLVDNIERRDGIRIRLDEIKNSYIQLLACQSRKNDFSLERYLELVKMSHSFETFN